MLESLAEITAQLTELKQTHPNLANLWLTYLLEEQEEKGISAAVLAQARHVVKTCAKIEDLDQGTINLLLTYKVTLS